MSTNHNRIRVADLETNQPNKILKTNLNGELEFSDANNLQAESYNALDCTTEGKSLDARQGKVLKDMIDNKTVNLASDAETQINTAVSEDSKVISRSKLFNWWQWVKSQTQTISGAWNFTNKVTLAAGNTTIPSLVIPNGNLTTTLQNGAIERDENGALWETHADNRNQIATTNYIDSNFKSDTYIPTLENILNVTGATLLNANYTKIGNIVNVMVALSATSKALGLDTEIGVSLPFNTSLSTDLLLGSAIVSTADGNNVYPALVYVTGSSTASIKFKLLSRGSAVKIVADFNYAIN